MLTAEDYIASEQAVIIWDEQRKVEHFIREANIHTKSPDIGFIVPTPSVPQLVEADARIFELAKEVGKPEKVRQVDFATPLEIFGPVLRGPMAILALPFMTLLTGMSGSSEEEHVKVLFELHVAGYRAVSLKADDAPALAKWLKQNGYGWTPQLEAWLKPYIASRWTVTAFKLTQPHPAKDAKVDPHIPFTTRAIRMSFATDRPFFPYSEPGARENARAASPYGRALRVAVLSSHRMQGKLEDGVKWPGELYFAGSSTPVKDSGWKATDWLSFAKLDGQMALPDTLTYWRDSSNPRPGKTDLFFSPGTDSSTFRRIEIDPSLMALHLIDFTNLNATVAGLLVAFLLPAAPLYCGWRLLRLTWTAGRPVTESKPKRRFHWNRILGASAIVLGVYYTLGCVAVDLFITYYLLDDGKPLPALCLNHTPLKIAAVMATMIYCGALALLSEPTSANIRPKPWLLVRGWNYLMSGATLFVGAAFALAIAVALFVHLTDGTPPVQKDTFATVVAYFLLDEYPTLAGLLSK